MGFPHPTADIPGDHPDVRASITPTVIDPYGHTAELMVGAADGAVTSGHVCVTMWVLNSRHDRIVLVRHHTLGWIAPGGHVMAGEALWDAALRELGEETGLTSGLVTPIWPHAFTVHAGDTSGDRRHRHWNVAFAFVADGEPALTGEPGCPTAWFPIGALPQHAPADLAELVPLLVAAAGGGNVRPEGPNDDHEHTAADTDD